MLLGGLVVIIALLSVATAVSVNRNFKIRAELIGAKAEIRLLQERLADRVRQEDVLRAAAKEEFENLAVKIMDSKSRQFQESSERNLEKLLGPFKERLKDFEKKVEETYQSEGRERHVLKSEVERLIQLNERMTKETNNLTQALKGDSKVQGDWGEMVLENILSASGLREGQEYIKQKSLEDEQGDRYRPDVLIQLPDGKQIIVDSKVSLKAYELYCRSESAEERERCLKEHMESLLSHVDDLAEKHYPKLKGIKSPEFVFLFTPIEPAYLLAMRNDPELATRAWKKGVAIVTSTTLFTSLKTVASIWRLENQNRNAQEIASEAAKLYDKFVGFHDDFEKIGRLFETGAVQYEEARRKLRDGPGNVFRKIERLRELGASPNKHLKPELLE